MTNYGKNAAKIETGEGELIANSCLQSEIYINGEVIKMPFLPIHKGIPYKEIKDEN